MHHRTWLTALALAGGMLVGTAAADHFLTMEVQPPIVVGNEPAQKETYTIWVGDSRLREDRKARSTIVDRSAGKMYVIKHTDKTYYALDLPIDFESMVPPDMLQQWRTVLSARKAEVSIKPSSETATIRGHAVKKHEAVVTDARGRSTKLTMWNVADPGFDTEGYKQLMREIHALQPSSADWIQKLFDSVEGYPVRMLRSQERPDGPVVWTEELLSIEEKPAPPQTWKPAAGYSEIEFNLLSVPPE